MTKIEVEYFVKSLVFGLFRFFAYHPERMACVAAVFGLLALGLFLLKRYYPRVVWMPLSIACLVWTVFAFLEVQAVADIRVDILFIWPFFFGTTALLIGISVLNMIRAIVNDEDRLWLASMKRRGLTSKKACGHILQALNVREGPGSEENRWVDGNVYTNGTTNRTRGSLDRTDAQRSAAGAGAGADRRAHQLRRRV